MKNLFAFLNAWLASQKGSTPSILSPKNVALLAFGFILFAALIFTGNQTSGIGLFASNVNATVYPYNSAIASQSGLLIIVGLAIIVIIALYDHYLK